jgi:hypothetical protein
MEYVAGYNCAMALPIYRDKWLAPERYVRQRTVNPDVIRHNRPCSGSIPSAVTGKMIQDISGAGNMFYLHTPQPETRPLTEKI